MPHHRWQAPALLLWPQAALVPLVNIALLLIGFLLLGPSLVTPTGIPLQLPGAITAEALGDSAVIVTITEHELVYLNGQLTTWDELPGRLGPLLGRGGQVLIKADHDVSMGRMTQLWDLCRKAGASRVALATTRPGDTP